MESLIIPNLLMCMFGGYLCICRMKFTSSRTKLPILVRYIMWFTAFVISGISWIWDANPTPLQIFLGACVIADLGLGFNAWKNGVPKYAQS